MITFGMVFCNLFVPFAHAKWYHLHCSYPHLDNKQSAAVIMAYIITGRAAHGRVGTLFQKLLKEEEEEHNLSLIDKSPYAAKNNKINDAPSKSAQNDNATNDNDIVFLWENAPRSETKSIRDIVKCYSHLPVSSMCIKLCAYDVLKISHCNSILIPPV